MNLERLSCRKRVELLCDYLDRELPPKAQKAVAAHRRSCLPCAAVLASLERTVAAVRGLRSAARVPVAARRALQAALKSPPATKGR